jgi:hypothetical protein
MALTHHSCGSGELPVKKKYSGSLDAYKAAVNDKLVF